MQPNVDVVERIFSDFRSNMLVLRQKGVDKLTKLLASGPTAEETATLKQRVFDMLSSERWEDRQTGFLASCAFVACGDEMKTTVEVCVSAVNDVEPRVRLAVGDFAEAHGAKFGIGIYEALKKPLLESIEQNFNRGEQNEPSSQLKKPADVAVKESLGLQLTTEGWKSLETSFKILNAIMKGAQELFVPHMSEALLDKILDCNEHPNRFIREIGCFVWESILKIADREFLDKWCVRIATLMKKSLGDNWSQVRYASSLATRALFLSAAEFQDRFMETLLPAMCLNRYYVAAGVRVYSIETWKQIMKSEGPALVAKYIDPVCEYYIAQSHADNHAVREAACYCIAELATKIDRKAVEPHVPRLIQGLIFCFKDMSWPVRDASCSALGDFVSVFPKESHSSMDELYTLWYNHLSENIPSVRENSATALGKIMEAYPDEAVSKIKSFIEELLPKALSQEAESEKYSDLSNETTFGVAAKLKRDNDPEVHMDKTTYSCGSLAPKLKRGTKEVDHGLARDIQPWESTDGAVYLLKELSKRHPKEAVKYFPMLQKVADVRSFAHYHSLQQTIWAQVPQIAENLGKRSFRQHIDMFLAPLFSAASSENRLCQNAAQQCALKLSKLLGERNFQEHLDPRQARAFQEMQQYMPPGWQIDTAPSY